MPALAADIVRATRQAKIITREDATLHTQFPDARDAVPSPDPGFFESATDAASALALKAALIGAYRRRFTVLAADEVWIDPLTGVPTAYVNDPEQGAALNALVSRVEVDMQNEKTKIEAVG